MIGTGTSMSHSNVASVLRRKSQRQGHRTIAVQPGFGVELLGASPSPKMLWALGRGGGFKDVAPRAYGFYWALARIHS